MLITTNLLVKIKWFVGCVGLLAVVGGCSRVAHSQSERLPIDAVTLGNSGSVQLVRSDSGQEYRLCGVEVAKGFEAMAQARLQALVSLSDVDVMLQQATGNTYEAFLVGLDGETPMEEGLLLDGLLVTTTDVEQCPNGGPRQLAQQIAQENQMGVWGVVVSPPVSPKSP